MTKQNIQISTLLKNGKNEAPDVIKNSDICSYLLFEAEKSKHFKRIEGKYGSYVRIKLNNYKKCLEVDPDKSRIIKSPPARGMRDSFEFTSLSVHMFIDFPAYIHKKEFVEKKGPYDWSAGTEKEPYYEGFDADIDNYHFAVIPHKMRNFKKKTRKNRISVQMSVLSYKLVKNPNCTIQEDLDKLCDYIRDYHIEKYQEHISNSIDFIFDIGDSK